MLEVEERRAVEAALRRFAERVDRALFSVEGPDGDLSRVPFLLDEAREIGLVAEPTADTPGYELGVWGRACQREGVERSLLSLEWLGQACAGFATAVHAQGLACLALDGRTGLRPALPVAVGFTPHYGVPLSDRASTVGSGLWLSRAGDALQLEGATHFLLTAGRPEKLVCFARLRGQDDSTPGWVVLLFDAETSGVRMAEVTGRTGLRATHQYHLHCQRVSVSPAAVIAEGESAWRLLARVMACDWLGQAAVALGVARRALRDSRDYAGQRYQGGAVIEDHPAVQLLQGTAEYDIGMQAAILFQYAERPLDSFDPLALLRWAIQARLAVVEHAHRAVTHCLQTLGGYGYIEDYGFEKRLRDVSMLKSLHGAPDQLKLFLNELA